MKVFNYSLNFYLYCMTNLEIRQTQSAIKSMLMLVLNFIILVLLENIVQLLLFKILTNYWKNINKGALFVGLSPGWNKLGLTTAVSSDRLTTCFRWIKIRAGLQFESIQLLRTYSVTKLRRFSSPLSTQAATAGSSRSPRLKNPWLQGDSNSSKNVCNRGVLIVWDEIISIWESEMVFSDRFNYIAGQSTLSHTCRRVWGVHESLRE